MMLVNEDFQWLVKILYEDGHCKQSDVLCLFIWLMQMGTPAFSEDTAVMYGICKVTGASGY